MGSHAFFLQLQGAENAVHESLSQGDRESAPITDAERALLAMVEKWTFQANRTSPEDMAQLRAHGWSNDQIAEAIYITALFAFFNRVADAFGLPDPDYFSNPPVGPPRQG